METTCAFGDYRDSYTRVSGSPSVPLSAQLKHPRDMTAGAALQTKLSNVVLYGGPFVYGSGTKAAVVLGVRSSTTYQTKRNFGGFAGVSLPLAQHLAITLEGQFKELVSARASLTYGF